MDSLSKSKWTPYLIVILVLTVLFALYYYVVAPKKSEVQMAQSTVDGLNAEITSLSQQRNAMVTQQPATPVNTFALRKKVPKQRGITQIIQTIEEIEAITGTRVESISFSNSDAPVSGAGLTDPNAPVTPAEGTPPIEGTASTPNPEVPANNGTATTTTNGTTETPAEQPTVMENPVTTIAPESLPPELKLITLSVTVIAPNFETLQLFIEEFEKIERVFKVDTFSFSLPGEEALFAEETTDEITSTIQLTTFYYEGAQ